ILFRYFNAAGANPNALIGERHDPETHLIPLALKTALGQYPHVKIFGVDYDTPDGTCIRDYIHVDDLSDAHIRGYKFLTSISENQAFNLGCGNGYSVREVIEMCREVSGCEIHTLETKRRPGDPPKLVSSSKKANEVLGWEIKHASLKEIIQTAWRWHRKEPK
ncbi:MAG: NAD-dependent epimerase/dehydratase family protein, partial [Elusimicrobiota bacterium]